MFAGTKLYSCSCACPALQGLQYKLPPQGRRLLQWLSTTITAYRDNYYYASVVFLFFHFSFFPSILKTKSPNSVWKAETRLVLYNYNKHFLIKEAFWWNLSPNLVKLTMCSVVIMTGICFLSLWTHHLQIWTVCNRNYLPSTWTTLLPHLIIPYMEISHDLVTK